jgi:DNA-binding IclR family transcriptional regulator
MSIKKAFRIVEIVCDSPKRLSIRDIACKANYSFATTHRILNTLKSIDAVRVMPDGRFQLGPNLTALLGRSSASLSQMRGIVDGELQTLLDRPAISVRLSVFDDGELVIVAGMDSGIDRRFCSKIGGRYEAYCTAPGKVLLASLRSEQLFQYLHAAPLLPVTGNTIVDPNRLKKELCHIRKVGYALDDQEFLEGVRCVSVPVRMQGRNEVAALSIASERFQLGDVGRIVPQLSASAGLLSEQLCRLPRGIRSLIESAEAA